MRVRAQYAKLSEEDVQTLVVDDKWLAALAATVQSELDQVSQTLWTDEKVFRRTAEL